MSDVAFMASRALVPSAAAEISIPTIEENPAERKRLQGVLAQRRYRERLRAARKASRNKPGQIRKTILSPSSIETPFQSKEQQTSSNNVAQDVEQLSLDDNVMSNLMTPDTNLYDDVVVLSYMLQQSDEPNDTADFGGVTHAFSDPSFLTNLSQSVISPPEDWIGLLQDSSSIDELETRQPSGSSIATPTTSPSPTFIRQNLLPNQSDTSSGIPSDGVYISTPSLNLVRAHITVLRAITYPPLEISTIWEPFAMSPFINKTFHPDLPLIHPSHSPSEIQLLVPHHPVIDLLPWPSVRDKFLQLLTLPVFCRPKKLQGDSPDVVMRLKSDMMDPTGGMRISGMDPFDKNNWEIGQKFFEEWWWLLDEEIIERSNYLRRARKEGPLVFRPKR